MCLGGIFASVLQTPGAAQLASVITNSVFQGIITAGLAGVAVAVLHGRDAEMADFMQDLSVWTQAIITVVMQQVITLLVIIVAAIPGGIVMMAAIPLDDKGPALIAGAAVMAIVILPALLCANAMMMFAVPLVVEKRMDFWSALGRSFDCVRRDLGGLILFQIVLGLIVGVGTMCTCVIGTIFFAPMASLALMLAYQDYFGFDEDRTVPPPDPSYLPPLQEWGSSPLADRGYEGSNPGSFEGPGDGLPPPPAPPRVPPSLPILPPRNQMGDMPAPMAEPSPMPLPPSVPVTPAPPPPFPPPVPPAARTQPPQPIPPPPVFGPPPSVGPPPPGFRPPLPRTGQAPPSGPPRDDDDFDPNRIPPPPPPPQA
ncbi:hypothetical protein GC173_17660 [bacterium]|nr:hypothetical protein [bacterium]